jgi:hypothetical protein
VQTSSHPSRPYSFRILDVRSPAPQIHTHLYSKRSMAFLPFMATPLHREPDRSSRGLEVIDPRNLSGYVLLGQEAVPAAHALGQKVEMSFKISSLSGSSDAGLRVFQETPPGHIHEHMRMPSHPMRIDG